MDQKPVVRLAHIKKSFGKNEVLKDISLDVMPGEVVAVIGPSGGGKSTLAKLIMGIEQPTSGSIVFNGQDITHASITARPFFEKRGYQVLRAQQVERRGILLTNYIMEKTR